jgi:hypothetical protein
VPGRLVPSLLVVVLLEVLILVLMMALGTGFELRRNSWAELRRIFEPSRRYSLSNECGEAERRDVLALLRRFVSSAWYPPLEPRRASGSECRVY